MFVSLRRAFRRLRPSAVRALFGAAFAIFGGGCATGGTVADNGETTTHGKGGEGGTPTSGGGGETASTSAHGGDATTSSASTSTTSTFAFAKSECAPGTYATGLDFENKLTCVAIDPMARTTINDKCALYLGWRDACTGCVLPPTKWGKTSPSACLNGVGTDNTCSEPTLDGTKVQMFGLNFDGDVNDDDKIHLGFYCPEGDGAITEGPCKNDKFATSLVDGVPQCVAAEAPVLSHVRARCSLYFGWRDACDGCTSAPDRWGRVGPTGCTNGTGDTSTCTAALLGANTVQLFGLSAGGDVDGNDKLYLALHCDEPTPDSTITKGACPAGMLVTKVEEDGTFTCESPAISVFNYFNEHCTTYFGWRDGCNGCVDPPSKWGRIKSGFCTNDNGVDNTCTQTILGGKTLEMFGLNTDGDVNGDDKLYVGYRCD